MHGSLICTRTSSAVVGCGQWRRNATDQWLKCKIIGGGTLHSGLGAWQVTMVALSHKSEVVERRSLSSYYTLTTATDTERLFHARQAGDWECTVAQGWFVDRPRRRVLCWKNEGGSDLERQQDAPVPCRWDSSTSCSERPHVSATGGTDRIFICRGTRSRDRRCLACRKLLH